jgi:hypothetical protein
LNEREAEQREKCSSSHGDGGEGDTEKRSKLNQERDDARTNNKNSNVPIHVM